VEQGEPLMILRYAPGQEYRLHSDAIAGAANQRTMTVLLYLNQGFAGGETHFPELDITIVPRGGEALLFDNLLVDGRPDPRARHAGKPVRAGTKWLATRWIRQRSVDPWTLVSA
jgi:prolyl 4-hydroxylase